MPTQESKQVFYTMKIHQIIIVYLLLFSFGLKAQNAEIESVSVAEQKSTVKKPVGFTHQPFLLLRLSPLTLFRYDNVFQYGVEIAPPIGKFSLVFDYGTGKGSKSFKKNVKTNYPENKTKVYHAELRTYFSDWYPFYALDKKPFGRYYALEYTNSTFDRVLRSDLINALKYGIADQTSYTEKRHDVRVKLGKHFHLHKHLFIDLNAGTGLARYSVSELGTVVPTELLPNNVGRFSKNYVHLPNQKGFKFSFAIGINVVVPL